MSHRAIVGIPFAIGVFTVLMLLGHASHGKFTWRNFGLALGATALWYALVCSVGLVN